MNEGFQLISTLAVVRRKLQRERLLKGLAFLLGGFVAASILSSYLLWQGNFSSEALLWTRLLGGGVLLFLAVRYLLQPAFRPPSTQRLARFLEERHSILQDRLSTAVEWTEASPVDPGIRELVERDAWRGLKDLAQPRLYRPQAALFWSLTLLVSLLVFASLFLTGPEAYRYSLGRILWSGFDHDPPPLYSIRVTPGSSRVARHADVEILATLQGFDSQKVGLFAHYGNMPGWEQARMEPGDRGNQFQFLFFDVREEIDYYVEAEGIRSETYSLRVWEVPRVEKLEIVLSFPEYTGLPEVVLENNGNIRALVGAAADLRIRADQTVRKGKIKLESGGDISLRLVGSRELEGRLQVEESDSYRIYFQDQEQVWNPGSAEYVVEALPDQPPLLSFRRPGRDLKVTNIEEVFAEVEVEDDHGISELALSFSVNGGAEQRVQLGNPGGSHSFSSSHIFYLEEFSLSPGDFVSYFAEASDALSASVTDIYFLEVEPYDRQYYQSQRGGVPAESQSLILSRRQKEIIAATFRLNRERRTFSASELEEHSRTLALVQQRLQVEAEAIVARIERRGGLGADARLGKMAEYINRAARHMEAAQGDLSRVKLREALPEERKSFQQLLRAEALFKEVQIAFSTSQSAAAAEELADLVDLDLDKTKNQYETLDQSQVAGRDQDLEEALEKLKELAKRQQQLGERQRRQSGGRSSGSRSYSQQKLAEETERLARELERLSRRQADPLADLSQQLKRAAREMRQAQSSRWSSQEAQMRARQAGERLKRTENALRQQRQQQMAERLEKLEVDSQRLVKGQEEVVTKVDELRARQQSGGVDQKFVRELRDLLREKAALQEQVQRLETALHQSARASSREPDVSQKLQRAGGEIRNRRIPEQMQESSRLLSRGWTRLAQPQEEEIWHDLKQLAKTVSEAKSSLGSGGSSPENPLQQALNQIRPLVERLEALKERVSGAQRPASGVPSAQIRQEWKERLKEAERIEQAVEGDPRLKREVGRLVGQMRRLNWERFFADPQEMARLKSQVIDGFRRLELEMGQSLRPGLEQLLGSASVEEIPPEFRRRVEEYYRALSRQDGPHSTR